MQILSADVACADVEIYDLGLCEKTFDLRSIPKNE